MADRLRVGFLVNPVAGVGGRPGMKGSDEPERVAPILAGLPYDETPAFQRGFAFFAQLEPNDKVLVSAPGPLGEDVLKAAIACGGPIFEVARDPAWKGRYRETTRDDTRRFVERLLLQDLDLLVFVGGDGTAVDVAGTIGDRLPILGVPSGVKMFSGVFAQSAAQAGSTINGLRPGFPTHAVDVLDLDEASYRTGSWIVGRQATCRVPEVEGVQAAKGGSMPLEAEAEADLVDWFEGWRRDGATYVLGSGATVAAIKRSLGGGSPLGVDVVRDDAFLVADGGEEAILEALGAEGQAWIVVSPTGGQGCVLGRGTAQISPGVVERVGVEQVVVVATPGKLLGLRELFVDTGEAEIDAKFPDYVRVRTDARTEKVFPLRKGPAPRVSPFRSPPHGR